MSSKDRRRAAPAAPAPAAPAGAAWPAAFFVFLVACAAFVPALHGRFVNWDDDHLILNNLAYRGFGWHNIRWMFTTLYLGNYTPLTWLSYAFDYGLWGLDPRGYHLTNVVLHGLNAAVFFAVGLRLYERALPAAAAEDSGRLRFAAAVSALFFALHPLRVESVAWAAERRDVLCGLFYLLSVFFYLRAQTISPDGRARGLTISLAMFLLSLLSKGMAVSLPLVLLILDVFPLARLSADPSRWPAPEAARVWREKIPYLLLALAFGAAGIVGQSRAGAVKSLAALSFSGRIAQASFAVLFYLWKTLLPFGLSPTYAPARDMSLLTSAYLFCFLLVLATTAVFIFLRRKFPSGLAVWIFYLAALFPVSGLVGIGGQAAADRYTYLPCLGWALLAGGFFAVRARGLPWKAAAVALLAGLFALTWRQTLVWRDSETLWRRSIALEPKLPLPRINLGESLAEQGRLDEAVLQYRGALDLNPRDADAQMGLGVALMRQGRTEEAIARYREALTIAPDGVETLSNLCAALCALGQLDEARQECDRALSLDPRHKGVHLNLGVILAKQGRLDEAAAHFRTALEIDPDFTDARNDLELALRLQAAPAR